MNPFFLNYEDRLREWKTLRNSIKNLELENVCIEVDNWWQRAPLVNHHLHPFDSNNWPDPWTILSENTYCVLTRAIGICYTLLLTDINDIQIMLAGDSQGDDHNLVIVGRAKYVLNYYPNSVLSTNLDEFKVTQMLDLEPLKKQIK